MTIVRSLRNLAASLTLRGKGMLAVGLGLAAGAVLSGQRELLSVALLVMLLPLLAAGLIARSGFTLGCTRTVSSQHASVGEPLEVEIDLRNLGARRTPTMLIEDAVPASMGSNVRRVAAPIAPGDHRTVHTTLHPQRRGRFRLGPLSVIGVDPLGLVRLRRSFRATTPVVITPRVIALTAGTPHAEHLGYGDATLAALAARGDDDVVPREYRVGDDLRRIHWRASARTGAMMVRREELPWTRRATVVLDDRAEAHGGSGTDSSFEIALSIVASIGCHLMHAGFDVEVIGLDGFTVCQRHGGLDGPQHLLDTLAIATLRPRSIVDDRVTARPWQSDFTIAVVSATPEMGVRLGHQAVRRSGDLGIAMILDPEQWTGGDGLTADQVLRDTLAGRWRAVAVPRGDLARSLPAAWTAALHDVATDAIGARP